MGVFVLGCVLELNMSARGCGGSSSSLPGTPGGEASPANSVLSWAVSFEKLLADPYGVQHFTVRHTLFFFYFHFQQVQEYLKC